MTETHLLNRRAFLASLAATPVLFNLISGCSIVTDDTGDGERNTNQRNANNQGGGTAELVSSSKSREPGTDPELAAAAVNRFGTDLLASLTTETPSANLVVSPLSIAAALAMAASGAAGTTEDEMASVLGADGDVASYLSAFQPSMNALLAGLDGLDNYDRGDEDVPAQRVQLDIANAVWGQSGFDWKPGFLDTLAQQYGAGVYTADFRSDVEAARRDVNEWVAEATDDQIPEIVQPDSVSELTRLMLVNAVNLAADWQDRFNEESTSDADFTTATGDVVTVPMMHQVRDRNAAEGDGWKAAELPYAFGRLKFVIAVPDDAQSNLPGIDDLIGQMVEREVDLQLPRFEIDYRTSLKDVLSQLGMPSAFGDGADFSSMTDDEPLRIGEVIHQATVTLDENGTKASAATVVDMRAGAAPGEELGPIEIIADRPFTFWLRDGETGVVIFTGRVNDPRP